MLNSSTVSTQSKQIIGEAKRRAVVYLLTLFHLRKKMGGFLDKPKTEKSRECNEGNGLRYGVVSMQGWRVEMEDSHTAVVGLPGGFKDWSFFAVFDGHCGSTVSAHCASNLLPTITETEDFKKISPKTAENDEENNELESTIRRAIHAGFLKLDETMRQMPCVANGEDKSGSTAVSTLISPTHFYIANCGDSRAVLCRNGEAAVCTMDHKPTVAAEKKRIQDAGGSVMIHRVNGSLAVSRALGDFEYKSVEGKGPTEQLVSPAPEIYVETRKPDEDQFLVLACDGIWDVMTNEDLCHFIRYQLTITEDLSKVCSAVVDHCLFKGSRDNMSIVLITFPAAPKIVKEEVEREKKFEDWIKEKTYS
ncbi:Alphabet [Daphnia magna]|uniref:Alphabet n=1 Tax=Daphnia magna TaxID=35525 RepID=A0A162RKC5_9CRUS|nr:Alphabet [Daphnia magna]